jgi:NDP-sugar pyrophosphorylase family protein
MDNSIVDHSAEISYSIIGIYCLVNSNLQEPIRIDSFSAIGDDVIIDAGSEIIASRTRPLSKTLMSRR